MGRNIKDSNSIRHAGAFVLESSLLAGVMALAVFITKKMPAPSFTNNEDYTSRNDLYVMLSLFVTNYIALNNTPMGDFIDKQRKRFLSRDMNKVEKAGRNLIVGTAELITLSAVAAFSIFITQFMPAPSVSDPDDYTTKMDFFMMFTLMSSLHTLIKNTPIENGVKALHQFVLPKNGSDKAMGMQVRERALRSTAVSIPEAGVLFGLMMAFAKLTTVIPQPQITHGQNEDFTTKTDLFVMVTTLMTMLVLLRNTSLGNQIESVHNKLVGKTAGALLDEYVEIAGNDDAHDNGQHKATGQQAGAATVTTPLLDNNASGTTGGIPQNPQQASPRRAPLFPEGDAANVQQHTAADDSSSRSSHTPQAGGSPNMFATNTTPADVNASTAPGLSLTRTDSDE